jgi:hypothetical protein
MTGDALRVVHACPGRVRLRAAKLKGAAAFARQAAARLRQVPGIREVEANAVTGSLLIYYNLPELTTPAAMLALSEATKELFPEIEPQTLLQGLECLTAPPPPTTGWLTGSLAAVNAQVAALTGGLDLKLLVPLFFLGLGIRSLLSAEKIHAPSWYDYLWFGFSSFMMLNRSTGEETAGGEGK